MRKSILNKLLISNIGLILVLIFSITLVISLFITFHTYQLEQERLAQMAQKTESLYESMTNNLISPSKLQNYMDAMGYITQSKIYMIQATLTQIDTLDTIGILSSDLESYLRSDLKTILQGNEVFRNSQYSTVFQSEMLFYGRPLFQNGMIQGAIIIYSPNTTLAKNIQSIFTINIIVAFFSLIIAFYIVYNNSKSLTLPLMQVKESVIQIANGSYIEDIPLTQYIELNDLTEAFNFMKNELNHLESEKKEFIKNISHEIKTPLMVITGYLEAMQDQLLDTDETQEALQIIYKESQHLTQLTKEIITQSSNRSPEFHLQKSLIVLSTLFNDVATLYKFNTMKSVEIIVDCDASLMFYGDLEKMRQILMNLISNSIKYSKNQVIIQLSSWILNNDLVIEIADNGIGMKPDELNRIFERYYRVLHAHPNPIEGDGLGLNIVKKLVALHHGRLEISSEPKKGTVIRILFPNFKESEVLHE